MLFFDKNENWTLFLDRDGVINRRIFDGYVTSTAEFVFLPYVFEGIKQLSGQFSRIIVVTNQQGVGKGLFSLEELEEIHTFMRHEFLRQDIKIDGIYAATNLKGASQDRRKPNSAMAWEAKADFPEIDFEKAWMVGDTDSDILFGKKLGMKTALVKSVEQTSVKADLVISHLKELADELIK